MGETAGTCVRSPTRAACRVSTRIAEGSSANVADCPPVSGLFVRAGQSSFRWRPAAGRTRNQRSAPLRVSGVRLPVLTGCYCFALQAGTNGSRELHLARSHCSTGGLAATRLRSLTVSFRCGAPDSAIHGGRCAGSYRCGSISDSFRRWLPAACQQSAFMRSAKRMIETCRRSFRHYPRLVMDQCGSRDHLHRCAIRQPSSAVCRGCCAINQVSRTDGTIGRSEAAKAYRRHLPLPRPGPTGVTVGCHAPEQRICGCEMPQPLAVSYIRRFRPAAAAQFLWRCGSLTAVSRP